MTPNRGHQSQLPGPRTASDQKFVDQFHDWAEGVAGALNAQPVSATEKMVLWNEFKRIVEKHTFARE